MLLARHKICEGKHENVTMTKGDFMKNFFKYIQECQSHSLVNIIGCFAVQVIVMLFNKIMLPFQLIGIMENIVSKGNNFLYYSDFCPAPYCVIFFPPS
jgi:hypothetical protein